MLASGSKFGEPGVRAGRHVFGFAEELGHEFGCLDGEVLFVRN